MVTAIDLEFLLAVEISPDRLANRSGDESAEPHQDGDGKKKRTGRAALNRLLDETDTSLTLTTLSRAATVLGRKFRIELEN